MNFSTDHKYIINLEKRIDRLKHITEEMDYYGFKNWEIVSAIDGDSITPTKPKAKHLPQSITGNQLACLRTHASIIKEAKKKKLEYVTILEDDCLFHKDFNLLYPKYLSQVLSNWDFLYIGANHCATPEQVTENVVKCKYANTTVCYVIRQSLYDHIIREAYNEEMPIDMIYAMKVQPFYNVYAFTPNLVSQKAGYSDIEKKDVDYSKYYNKNANV